MKRRLVIASFLALVIVGCIPERYTWSPDGRWMTVLSQDGLRIADANGNLSAPILQNVKVATWFSDSRRLLVATDAQPTTWDDLKSYLTADQITSITAAAGRVHDAGMVYDWKQPNINWTVFMDSVHKQAQQAQGDAAAEIYADFGNGIGIYLRDHEDQALKAKMPDDQWKTVVGLNQQLCLLEICAFDGESFNVEQRVALPTQDAVELRISPRENMALVVISGTHGDDSVCDLWETSLDGSGSPIKLSDSAAWYPDWSPDGKYVYYVRAVSPKPSNGDTRLGSLSRLQVIDDKGKMIPNPNNSGPEDLVGVLFSGVERVRCQKDGTVIFATVDVNLPATSGDLPSKPQLFSLTPGQPTVTRLLTRKAFEQVGSGAWWFELSPDNTKVSIPGETGKVDIVDLSDGNVTEVQKQDMPSYGNGGGDSLVTVPTWRNDDQLTFAVPGTDNDHWGVALWTISKATSQVLSGNWPSETLTDKQPTTQPATQAAAQP
jgi:Tol biopolymer transport system component